MKTPVTKEMQVHTYAIMNRVEDSHWWFVGRRAILENFLVQICSESRLQAANLAEEFAKGKIQDIGKDLPEGDTQSVIRILDVGCGTGVNLEMLAKFGEAEGVDVSDDALKFCKEKGLNAQKGLAEKLPFEDESFSLATALDVIEHLDNDTLGLKEIHRVLGKNGQALIFVPAFMWLWGVQDDISNHRIRYTRKQITEKIKKSGFKIERATYANITFFIPIFIGRFFMKLTGIKPKSENNINVSALNGLFGKIFGAERFWLKYANIPFGVSIIVVAKKI